MTIGTSHFTSREAATSYYRNYGFRSEDVEEKIKQGEIKIGPPQAKEGETIFINQEEGRYFVKVNS
jgi:hypothetical protein